jgi:hypothetical protein
MLESFASSVVIVPLVDFSISRRIVRFGVHSGSKMVVMVCWRRCRIVVMAWREERWVRSGGVLEFSCEAA